MRVLFFVPGGAKAQLDALPLAAQVADGLAAQLQVACPAAMAPLWTLLPAVEKILPFGFDAAVSLADWTNLLGCVREPDFQACLNLASNWRLDLLLSLSHIPVRVASAGFSATSIISSADLLDFLAPLGLSPNPEPFQLKLPAKALAKAQAEFPQGNGPLLLLAPGGGSDDWPQSQWDALPNGVQQHLPQARICGFSGLNLINQAAQVASADVLVSSNPVASRLAALTGVTLVDLEQLRGDQPLNQLNQKSVFKALGFATAA